MNRTIVIAGVTVAALSLSACTSMGQKSAIEALNNATFTGSPFTKALAASYREYTNAQRYNPLNFGDASHFARKGLAAATGVIVMPEVVSDWTLNDKEMIELANARARLVTVLEGGARELAPEQAAMAQARFDCWIQQQEKSWTGEPGCKVSFLEMVAAAEKAVTQPVEFPAPLAAEAAAAHAEQPTGADGLGTLDFSGVGMSPGAVKETNFVVFFDWDQNTPSAGADAVLDAVAADIKKRQNLKRVIVSGHADTSGSEGYNQKLSATRAHAVADALRQRGIAPSLVRAEGRGETDLSVKTPDGVREPANRRAEITLE
jgi:OOP family OmpA-OmpF porin